VGTVKIVTSQVASVGTFGSKTPQGKAAVPKKGKNVSLSENTSSSIALIQMKE